MLKILLGGGVKALMARSLNFCYASLTRLLSRADYIIIIMSLSYLFIQQELNESDEEELDGIHFSHKMGNLAR